MKRIVLVILSSLIIGVLHTSCNANSENNDDCLCLFDFTHEETASIIGKWKLEKIRVNSKLGFSCIDCSTTNVVYEFKENGILTVSRHAEHLGLHESGKYSFINDEWGMGQDGCPWGLSINEGTTNWYILSSKKLIIDYSPGDGATYFFVKNGN